MNLKWIIPLTLVLLLPFTGCVEEKRYEDDKFLDWLKDSISDIGDLNAHLSDALAENDYSEIEFLAGILSEKNLHYYHEAQEFVVSDKYKDLQYHAVKHFYYRYLSDINLKEYVRCKKEGDPASALDYINTAIDYMEKSTSELEYINEFLKSIE